MPDARTLPAKAIGAAVNALAGTAVRPLRSPVAEALAWETDVIELGEPTKPVTR